MPLTGMILTGMILTDMPLTGMILTGTEAAGVPWACLLPPQLQAQGCGSGREEAVPTHGMHGENRLAASQFSLTTCRWYSGTQWYKGSRRAWGPSFRPKAVAMGGEKQFPYMVCRGKGPPEV